MLQAHRPIDAEEHGHRERMLALVDTGDACLHRSHFVPGHFTASAFVLSPDRASILLIFHSKLQRWLQPGGHLEDTDTSVIAAARREVSEEIGIEDPPLMLDHIFDVDVHRIPRLRDVPSHEHFDVRFAFVVPDLRFIAGDDALIARWFSLNDVINETSDRSVLRAIDKLRG